MFSNLEKKHLFRIQNIVLGIFSEQDGVGDDDILSNSLALIVLVDKNN